MKKIVVFCFCVLILSSCSLNNGKKEGDLNNKNSLGNNSTESIIIPSGGAGGADF